MIAELFNKLKAGNSRTAKAGKQILLSFIFQAISILVSLLYVPLLLNYLSQEKYGIWLTLSSIIGWVSFFDIGLGNGMRNKVAECITLGQTERANKYVSTTYALLAIIFIGFLALFWLANPFINWNQILNSLTIPADELTLLAAIVYTFFIIRFIVQLVGVIYIADQKPAVNNAVNAFAGIFSLGGVYWLIKNSASGNIVLLGTIVSAMPVILFILLSLYAFSNRYKHLKPTLKNVDFSLSRDLLSLGGKFFFLQLSAVILYSTTSFFITQFYGPEEVVVYNLSFKYFQMPIMVYTIVLSPLWSSVTNAWVSNDFDWLRATMRRLNYVSAAFIAIIIIMIFCADFVFEAWVGKKVRVPLQLNILMALYAAMNIFVAPYSYFINGTGKLALTMLFASAGVLLYFIFVYIFGHTFSNSTGILLAIIVPYVLSATFQPIQTYRLLQKNAKGIFLR
jgi:O-antigen/teichoic acid export membrane protein